VLATVVQLAALDVPEQRSPSARPGDVLSPGAGASPLADLPELAIEEEL
jgi:hypothetical protein